MSEISFPLIARQHVKIISGGKSYYLNIKAQSQPKVYTQDYLLLPGASLSNQVPTIGGLNIFDTDDLHLTQWVTWIDNKYLGVAWKINAQEENQLQGTVSPLTHDTSPTGSTSAPFFIYNQPRANLTYTLINNSTVYPIRGTLKLILYVFLVEIETSAPAVYSVAEYSLSGATA